MTVAEIFIKAADGRAKYISHQLFGREAFFDTPAQEWLEIKFEFPEFARKQVICAPLDPYGCGAPRSLESVAKQLGRDARYSAEALERKQSDAGPV